jgi:hypothetical protein
MTDKIIVCVIAIVLGGIVVPLILNHFCDKWGWFK